MVTVQVYSDSVMAGLGQSLLESRGIQTAMLGLNSAYGGGGSSDWEGSIRLQVFADDVAEAQRILQEREGVIPLSDDFVPPEEEPA